MVIFYHLGEMEMFVSDPSVVMDLAKMVDNKLINKNSFFKNYLLSTRLKDNVLVMGRCQEQIRRRRAFMSCFSGAHNFLIMD